MRHEIYTVIFMQGINRTSNVQNCIVVAYDEFMGAHKYLPVFDIFNYIHCSLSCGGGQKTSTTVPQAKMVTGDIHHRGMGFCGTHVWKTSHPQAMEFFCTQKLGPMGGCRVPPSHIICKNFFIIQALCAKKYVPPQSVHTLRFPFSCLPAAAVDKLPQIHAMTLPTDFDIHMLVIWPCDHDKIVTNWRTYVDIFTSISEENKNTCK